jgi:hypothetical protein
MDKLTKIIEDGVVDSPPSCGDIPLSVSSPLPLRKKSRSMVLNLGTKSDSQPSRKLYNTTSSSIPCGMKKVNSKNLILLVIV